MPSARASSAVRAELTAEAGRVEARIDGSLIPVLDARVPSRALDQESKAALAKLERRSGTAHALIRQQAEEFGVAFRATLNELAGGQAPPDVMALAALAVDAVVDHQAVKLVARGSIGRWCEAELDEDIARAEERVTATHRVVAGLAVIARDLLQSARAAAKEARSTGSPTADLMARLGVGASPTVPISPPGVGVIGAPSPSILPPTEGTE